MASARTEPESFSASATVSPAAASPDAETAAKKIAEAEIAIIRRIFVIS
jgi:hypothetical protein